MKKVTFFVLFATFFFTGCGYKNPNSHTYNYPVAPQSPVVETYCNQRIEDTYQNLENLKDSSVQKWFKQESIFARNILDNISGRTKIVEKLKAYNDRQKLKVKSIIVRKNGSYFYLKERASDYTGSLYYRTALDSTDELLFDPTSYKPETKKKYIIRNFEPSWDGNKVAISLTYSGKEFSEILIIDVKTKQLLAEGVQNCWYIENWLPDNSGIIYASLNENYATSSDHFKNMRSVIYRIGDAPTSVTDIFSKDLLPGLQMTDADLPFVSFDEQSDNFVMGAIAGATAYYDTYYAKAEEVFKSGKANWFPLFKKEDKIKKALLKGDSLYVISAKNLSSYQILKKALGNDNLKEYETVIEPGENEIIEDFIITSQGIVYSTSTNGVKYKLYHYKNGQHKELRLPVKAGYIELNCISANAPEFWVTTMGWLNDYTRFSYNYASGEFVEEPLAQSADYPEFENLIVQEVEVKAHDGELIPLSIIYTKDLVLDNSHPTLLYGYGSYGVSVEPFFSPTWLTWTELGGVIAIAHVRGGGEKGDAWYLGGKKSTKPNTWKDIISCTEYMINEGYTSNKKTVLLGVSAGGILVGRAMTERPDLYAVAISNVGDMNALRSEEAPNGANNVKEFGSYKVPGECEALIEMDAYLQIKKNTAYPATLITAGMNDSRVTAWLPGKFAAKLQVLNISDNPIIFDVDYNAGHGVSDSKWKYLESKADFYSFALWQTGHPDFQLKEQN